MMLFTEKTSRYFSFLPTATAIIIKQTDDWQKINYAGELQIVKYIDRIIQATDTKGKLAFTKTRDQEMHPVSLPVTLGVMPDYGFTGTGVAY